MEITVKIKGLSISLEKATNPHFRTALCAANPHEKFEAIFQHLSQRRVLCWALFAEVWLSQHLAPLATTAAPLFPAPSISSDCWEHYSLHVCLHLHHRSWTHLGRTNTGKVGRRRTESVEPLFNICRSQKVTSFTPFVSAVCEPDAHENQDGGQHCLRLLKKF